MSQMERAEYEIREVIRKLILRAHDTGQNCQKTKKGIQDIFSLDEAKAEEKMVKYWAQEDK